MHVYFDEFVGDREGRFENADERYITQVNLTMRNSRELIGAFINANA